MRALILLLFCCVLALSGLGCGGSVAWKATSSQKPLISVNGYCIELPDHWMIYDKEMTVLTRHGATMDMVQIKKVRLGSPLPYTTLVLDSLQETFELAEVVLNNLRAAPGIYDLTLEEESPAEVDDNEGFLVRFSYALESGMIRKCFLYGFTNDKWYYEIGYYALAEHYFEESIDEYLSVVKSFKILKP